MNSPTTAVGYISAKEWDAFNMMLSSSSTDDAIAAEVMGWEPKGDRWYDAGSSTPYYRSAANSIPEHYERFRPSSDSRWLAMVLRETGQYGALLGYNWGMPGKNHTATVNVTPDKGLQVTAAALSIELAVCRAALIVALVRKRMREADEAAKSNREPPA